jgi:hypothetical protein
VTVSQVANPATEEQEAIAIGTKLVCQGGYSCWAPGQMWPLSLRVAS